MRSLLLSSLETTLIDVQQTVNRLEQLVRSLYTQTTREPFGLHEPVPEEAVPMSRESSSGSGVSPPTGSLRFGPRSDTGLSDASTLIPKRTSVYTLLGVNAASSSSSSTSPPLEWIWLHEQFTAALSRSVGLEQTNLCIVLDGVVRWLEEVITPCYILSFREFFVPLQPISLDRLTRLKL